MRLFLSSYIEGLLKKARYEHDPATKSWCASIAALPGAYAQGDTVEEARNELAEVVEEYVYVSLAEKQTLPHFKKFRKPAHHRVHA